MWNFETAQKTAGRDRIRKMAFAALFAAVAVLLSPFSFPIGPSRCFPFQHAVNAISGVILGPFWACGTAFTSSIVRNMLGTGTLLAFPGSLFGALAVGFASRLLPQKHSLLASFAEPLATATLGAWVASLIASTPEGRSGVFYTLSVAFLASSAPGALIGYMILRLLKRGSNTR